MCISADTSRPQAFWSRDLNEYILPYDAVRTAGDPEQTLMEFLTSTYEAAATTGNWDRTALECPLGAPVVPRPIAQSRQRVRASPRPEGEPCAPLPNYVRYVQTVLMNVRFEGITELTRR